MSVSSDDGHLSVGPARLVVVTLDSRTGPEEWVGVLAVVDDVPRPRAQWLRCECKEG